MGQIQIRIATLDDLEDLLAMEQGVIEAERPFDPTIRQPPVVYYDLKGMLVDDSYYVLVAEADGQIVSSGYATTKPARPYLDHSHFAYFGFMYTLPEYRGRGINGRIIDELRNWARQQGLKEVRLTVYPENEPAIRAYEKKGFVSHLIEMRIEDRGGQYSG